MLLLLSLNYYGHALHGLVHMVYKYKFNLKSTCVIIRIIIKCIEWRIFENDLKKQVNLLLFLLIIYS